MFLAQSRNRFEVFRQRTVELLEDGEHFVVSLAVLGDDGRLAGLLDRGVARLSHVLVLARSDGGQQRDPKRRALFGVDGDCWLAKHVGLDLTPECTFRSAARDTNLADRNV